MPWCYRGDCSSAVRGRRQGRNRSLLPATLVDSRLHLHRLCVSQVNLDFSSEADMVTMMRVSIALQPISTKLFANSPFYDGKPSGYLSWRSHVWQRTDLARRVPLKLPCLILIAVIETRRVMPGLGTHGIAAS